MIQNEADATSAQIYGQGLAMMMSGHADKAIPILQRLRDADPTVVQYHTALGQAQLESGQGKASLTTLAKARELFPRNVAVTVRHAEALMQTGDPKRAHEILLDLFNVVAPTPEQARLTALAANAAGDVADSYFYMSEYHIMSGDLPLAVNQLQLALQVPKITSVQRARFEARLDEVQQAMPSGGVQRRVAPSMTRRVRSLDDGRIEADVRASPSVRAASGYETSPNESLHAARVVAQAALSQRRIASPHVFPDWWRDCAGASDCSDCGPSDECGLCQHSGSYHDG